MADRHQGQAANKRCGECGLCCKLPKITVLNKPYNTWCQHWNKNCQIYQDRPSPCRGFICMWLGSPKMPDNMRPDKVKLYVHAPVSSDVFEVMVDPAYPLAWRQGRGKEIVDTLLKQGNHLLIIIGTERTFLQAKGKPVPDWIKAEIAKLTQAKTHDV